MVPATRKADQMKVAFIAGKYRGKTDYETAFNTRAAELIAVELWKMGFAVICPHKNSYMFAGITDEGHFLTAYREIIRRCVDIVVTVPDWPYSPGACNEVELCNKLNIPVFHWPRDISAIDQFAHEPDRDTQIDHARYQEQLRD